jgi:hypothetical protein
VSKRLISLERPIAILLAMQMFAAQVLAVQVPLFCTVRVIFARRRPLALLGSPRHKQGDESGRQD